MRRKDLKAIQCGKKVMHQTINRSKKWLRMCIFVSNIKRHKKRFGKNCMRKTYENQLTFGSVEIDQIKFDPKSRDELPKILKGLQYIYTEPRIRTEVFTLLEKLVPKHVSKTKGRKGMDLWKILVLSTIRLGCNWDYDKLHEMSNSHLSIREMLGHDRSDWEDRHYYELQTIKDNVSLITPEFLEELNLVVVKAAHDLLSKKKEKT